MQVNMKSQNLNFGAEVLGNEVFWKQVERPNIALEAIEKSDLVDSVEFVVKEADTSSAYSVTFIKSVEGVLKAFKMVFRSAKSVVEVLNNTNAIMQSIEFKNLLEMMKNL